MVRYKYSRTARQLSFEPSDAHARTGGPKESSALSDLLPFISTDFPRAASLITLTMQAVQTSKTLANSYQSTQRYNPEDSHLNIKRIRSYFVVHTNRPALLETVRPQAHSFQPLSGCAEAPPPQRSALSCRAIPNRNMGCTVSRQAPEIIFNRNYLFV
jgi:hypothetical protein